MKFAFYFGRKIVIFLEIYEVCQLFFAHARIIRVCAKKKPKYIEYVCNV